MIDPQLALAAAAGTAAPVACSAPCVLVVGAGGALGSAVMEELLGSQRFRRVAALVEQPVVAAVAGLTLLTWDDDLLQRLAPDTALLVFDRERKAFRREVAFHWPQPAELPQQAARLAAAGVRRMVVVVPHRAALLPQALQQGLATLDEAAVARLGLEQLVFMRMATSARRRSAADQSGALSGLQRLADGVLSQLHWMAPQREQAVQPRTVAKVAATLAVLLPQARPATRVMPAQVLWHAAQQRDVVDTVQAWLDGATLPPLPARKHLRL